jgi:hypothetical protein
MEPFHRQFPVPWIIPCSSRFVVFPIPTHFPLDPLWLFFSRHWDDQIGLTVQPCPVLSRSTQPALALCMGNCDFGPFTPASLCCQSRRVLHASGVSRKPFTHMPTPHSFSSQHIKAGSPLTSDPCIMIHSSFLLYPGLMESCIQRPPQPVLPHVLLGSHSTSSVLSTLPPAFFLRCFCPKQLLGDDILGFQVYQSRTTFSSVPVVNLHLSVLPLPLPVSEEELGRECVAIWGLMVEHTD